MSVLEKFKLVELITTRTDAVATFVSGNQIKFNSATHVDLGYPAYIQMFVDDNSKIWSKAMTTKYQRIPLIVDALFMTDGSFQPLKLIYRDTTFEITRVVSKRRYCPRVVRAIAPIEYTVIIDSQERKIYYEADTNTWFSVKEVYVRDERPSNPA